jgi:hypothetical protein
MRISAIITLLVALAVPAAALAEKGPATENLSIESANGYVKLFGRGGLLGRITFGSVHIVDLTPNDRFPPVINGIARGTSVSYKGGEISFRILGGQYRIVVRGEGISIAARGRGVALLQGTPDLLGSTGIWAVGGDADCRSAAETCEPLPDNLRRVSFGFEGAPSPSSKPTP